MFVLISSVTVYGMYLLSVSQKLALKFVKWEILLIIVGVSSCGILSMC